MISEHKTQKSGFTLLELSIVLVVIGLTVGGITVGRELIRSSETQSIIKDKAEFATSVSTFKSRYRKYPGDLNNASAYWSSTVDGDGDGKIDYIGGGLGEEYYAWQQLTLAGMLEGNYEGAVDSLPISGLPNGVYRLSYQTNVYGYDGLLLSLNAANPGDLANGPILSPAETYALDAKVDDGAADSGIVMGFNEEGVPGCVTNDYTAGSGDYLTGDDIKCKVFFKLLQ